MKSLAVRVLGDFAVDGLEPQALGSRKGRQALHLLALAGGRVVPSGVLADALWADAPPARPEEQISVLLSRLRSVLGRDRIEHRDGGYLLRCDWLDAAELAALVEEMGRRRAAGNVAGAASAARVALSLALGAAPAGAPGEWGGCAWRTWNGWSGAPAGRQPRRCLRSVTGPPPPTPRPRRCGTSGISMSRLYGPGHFTEDPYSQIVSPHGIPVDDLVSVLQKEIRRGCVGNAVLAAYEMVITSPDVAQHLWRRLRLIAVEDVGMGLPLGPVLIDVLHRNFDTLGGEWMMACHAVRLLASAPKDRTSSEHADWVVAKVARGEALAEVPDYAHCVHTRAGQERGRGLMQWWDNGAQVRGELPSADHRYRDELIEIHRRDEAANGTAPPPSRYTGT